jgi:hypothetical protein
VSGCAVKLPVTVVRCWAQRCAPRTANSTLHRVACLRTSRWATHSFCFCKVFPAGVTSKLSAHTFTFRFVLPFTKLFMWKFRADLRTLPRRNNAGPTAWQNYASQRQQSATATFRTVKENKTDGRTGGGFGTHGKMGNECTVFFGKAERDSLWDLGVQRRIILK